MRVYRKKDFLESNWSGGKTLELAIFPEDAKYLDRDFLWRLSTANSDRDESSFTKLPDYDRILMVLEGDVVLAHGDVRTAHLAALEQDSFDGAIKTKCFGKLLRDYNLIYRKGCKGRMDLVSLRSKAAPLPMSSEAMDAAVSYGIFCLDGYAVVSCGEESEMVKPGEQAVVNFPGGVAADILLMGEGKSIVTEVIMGKAEPAGAGCGEAGADGADGFGAAGSAGSFGAAESRTAGSAGGEGAASGSAGGAGPAASEGGSDYLTSLRLFFGRNRWAMILRREGRSQIYYDRAMSQALRKLERWYITELSWVLGVILCFVPMAAGLGGGTCLCIAIAFTIVHLLGIVPLIYMSRLPRPFAAHMKRVSELNAAERAFHEEEISEDPHFEKLMSRYKQDDENYFADESSPLYRLVKKK